jgi:hypothetical protein
MTYYYNVSGAILNFTRLENINELVQTCQVAVFKIVLAGLPRLVMMDMAVLAGEGEDRAER